MKLKEITGFLEKSVPLSFQESYDNSGLQTGDPGMEIKAALLTVDVTEEVIGEAAATGCNLVISHHPVIFQPLRKLTGSTIPERVIIRSVKENIAIYSAHTNLDAASFGVSRKMAEKIKLKNVTVLSPKKDALLKLVTFVPEQHLKKVMDAVFGAGAGVIGNYDSCSFNASGYGTFRGNEDTNPFAGKKLELHSENEIRFETVLPAFLKEAVVRALMEAHPYEEVAYDLYMLDNDYYGAGLGCTGDLEEDAGEKEFLEMLSHVFSAGGIRYSGMNGRKIKRVALCGGAGISLLKAAIISGADAFVTGDIKYHDFFNTEGKLLLADIGHFESEKFTTEILYDLIIKNFPTFALRFSETNTNPINYL